MPFDAAKLARFRVQIGRRLDELKLKADDSLDVAMDVMMQEQVDSYFRIEQGLEEIDRTLGLLRMDLEQIGDQAGALRLQSRLEFIEDRWDEFDSEIRQRPRRRRRKINFADFFKTASGGGSEPPGAKGEINSFFDAYEVLGLSEGCSMPEITAAFRQRVKRLHPDVRKGDRSAEPELRRIIEAYQFLKLNFSLTLTEPPRGV